MNFIEELSQKALQDKYLKLLIYKLETIYGEKTFKYSEKKSLTNKEYNDLLRFSDILCRSKNSEARNISLRIISLLYEIIEDKNDEQFKLFSANVLMKLGNFPSLKIIGDISEINDEEVIIDKITKEVMQKAPLLERRGEEDLLETSKSLTFTDAQYEVFEAVKNSNHYSFSGATSFGKSFIFESFIKFLINQYNGSVNIAFLVPTRALINQVCLKLKEEIKDDRYEIISHPKVPLLYKTKGKKYIFVFTAERLISYFADMENPAINYLFIDEAHKLLSDDQRTPLLYHALSQAKRKSVNMYFASPNIPNVDVFLKLFNSSTEESQAVKESSVIQNRFFIDSFKRKSIMFTEFGEDIQLNGINYYDDKNNNLKEILLKLGDKKQNIIYCNTIQYTIDFALAFSQNLDIVNSEKINNLIELIKKTVHEQYFLIDCLKKRVAFHFGGIPQRIRERIEELFREGEISYLFCTSTLLEGVNLPAKNIFILSSKIGLKKMNSIDFWNLAGRAGRLTKDLGGNIFCCRILDVEGYWKKEEDINVIRNKEIEELTPIVLRKNDGNLYKNIHNSLLNKPFTKKTMTDDEKKSIETYGNILFYQESVKNDSVLRIRFLDKNKAEGKKTLEKLTRKNKIPDTVLLQSVNIKVDIQNNIFQKELLPFPTDTDYQSCVTLLNRLYVDYMWDKVESGGNNPLVKKGSNEKLRYYAVLIHNWVNSKPLFLIIKETINYYHNDGRCRDIEVTTNNFERFNRENQEHVNKLINDLMKNLENNIRFKIKNYVRNYSLLYEAKGNTIQNNWADYLEYGTTDNFIAEIQNIGFPRHLATFLKEHHSDCFELNLSGEIINFDLEKLENELDREKFNSEFEELNKILEWN